MPKQKTHKGTAKRIKVTATGKLLRRNAFRNHFLEKKSASRKRNYTKSTSVKGKSEKTIKKQLGA